jgi:hypothetical protein
MKRQLQTIKTHWTVLGAMPMAAKARSAAASCSSRDGSAIAEGERGGRGMDERR